MKSSTKRKIAIFAVLIGLIIILISVKKIKASRENRILAETYEDIAFETPEDLGKSIASESDFNRPSDIEGWTVADKMAYGLAGTDGSDTDGDGLTDKEELEVYNTDPLEASTAGDMYTDKYKLDNDMDVNKKYDDYTGSVEFKFNECSEVHLEAHHPEDLKTQIYQVTEDDYWHGGPKGAIVAYYISMPCGKISIDLSNICPGIKEKKLTVIKEIIHYNKTRLGHDDVLMGEAEFTLKDNILTLNEEFYHLDYQTFILYIYEKDTSNPFTDFFGIDTSYKFDIDALDILDAGDGVKELTYHAITVCKMPLIKEIFGGKPEVYYVSTGVPEEDEIMVRKMYDFAMDYTASKTETDNAQVFAKETSTFLLSDVKEITEAEYQKLLLKNQLIESSHRQEWYDEDFLYGIGDIFSDFYKWFICSYYTYDDVKDEMADQHNAAICYTKAEADLARASLPGSTSTRAVKDGPKGNKIPFNMSEDTLPFKNFKSEYTGGNCAGFSYLTAQLYNNGSIPVSDTYYVHANDSAFKGDVTYDLSKYPELSTLTDRGLGDYKDLYYYNTLNERKYSDADYEFVKMMAVLWRKCNDMAHEQNYYETTQCSETQLSWQTILNVIDEIDKGNICIMNYYTTSTDDLYMDHNISAYWFYMPDGVYNDRSRIGAHSIVIYGYEKVRDDYYDLYIYDNNYPNNIYAAGTKRYPVVTKVGCFKSDFKNWDEDKGGWYTYRFSTVGLRYMPYYIDENGKYHNLKGTMANHYTAAWMKVGFFTGDLKLLNEYEVIPDEFYEDEMFLAHGWDSCYGMRGFDDSAWDYVPAANNN